jgi:hypothetical protein
MAQHGEHEVRRPVDAQDVQESLDFLSSYVSRAGVHRAGIHRGFNAGPAAPRPAAVKEFATATAAAPTAAVELDADSPADFQRVVAYLRKRYGDPDCNTGAASLNDDDVARLAQCVDDDVCNLARRERGEPRRAPRDTPTSSSGSEDVPADSEVAAAPRNATLQFPIPTSLRRAMEILRLGEPVLKFSSSKGKPAPRFLSVRSDRALHDSDMVVMPHLCWAVSRSEAPSGMLPLVQLADVLSGPSVKMQRGQEQVTGLRGEAVDDGRCSSLLFSSRSLDVAFASPEKCMQWRRALLLVAERNRALQ